MEVELFEGVEPDPSVDTVLRGAARMREFQPDWIVSIGGGSPIDAAKAMWAFYEYPDTTFESLCIPFNFPRSAPRRASVQFPPRPVRRPKSPRFPSSRITKKA